MMSYFDSFNSTPRPLHATTSGKLFIKGDSIKYSINMVN